LAHGVDILVATPGRLLDLIDRRALALSGVQILVLDEADRMLDLGFIHALKRIVKMLPRQRQTLLFSATMPRTIAALSEEYLNDPVKVVVTPPATTVERVDQAVTFVPSERKRELLATLLRASHFERVLVFTRTKHGADKVVRHLSQAGIDSAAIHGNKSQPQRERALAGFRAGRTRVLVATDIASRGIDVEGVSHVVNFELPNVPEDYVHRIGRTARAGAAGSAISLCSDEERPYLRDIERLTRVPIAVVAAPSAMRIASGSSTRRAPEHPLPQPRHAPPPQTHAGRRGKTTQRPMHPGNGNRHHNAATAADPLPAFLRRRPQRPQDKSALQPVRP
jgi:ATP-dependent RNA helicase RhlE